MSSSISPYPQNYSRHFKEFHIRSATKSDCSEILKLIHCLAEYEKEPNSVHINEETLMKDGFGDFPLFGCVLAERESDKKVVGMALYYTIYSTWEGRALYLEDLIVYPEFRKLGLGKALFESGSHISKLMNCARYQFVVLDWNTPSQEFYHKEGCSSLKEWIMYRQNIDERDRIAKEIESNTH